MKNKKFLIIGVIVLVITLVIILLVRRERNVNVYTYPDSLVVSNHTDHKNVDTYSQIIINKIYNYDTVNLNVFYTPKDYSTDEIDVAGFIQKNPFVPHTYIIFMKKGGLSISIKKFLSHELIHLQQMEIGDLIQLQNQTKMVYLNDTIDLFQIPYDQRPYEKDASIKENGILKSLNHLLYSK